MPRKRRIALPGEVHHVISRGLDGATIFADDTDRKRFVSTLGRILSQEQCLCYAWSLMSNHYHLVLRPTAFNLARVMRRLNGSYARYFNRRHQRRGYLFQDRYKSLATQDFRYFRELIRYVHLNPIRAGTVKNLSALERYPWCGQAAMVGKTGEPWHSSSEALKRFGGSTASARAAYLAFLREGLLKDETTVGDDFAPEVVDSVAAAASDKRCVGEESFVRRILERAEKDLLSGMRRRKSRPPLQAVLKGAAQNFAIAEGSMMVRGRNNARSEARRAFCASARDVYGYTIREIAAFLGVNPSSVVRLLYTQKETLREKRKSN